MDRGSNVNFIVKLTIKFITYMKIHLNNLMCSVVVNVTEGLLWFHEPSQ